MGGPREAFLERVRRAAAAGNGAAPAPPLPERGAVGYQGGGDPVARFTSEFTNAGGNVHLVPDDAAARDRVVELLRRAGASRVLLGRGPVVDRLRLADALAPLGVAVTDPPRPDEARHDFFSADAGVSGVDHLIAETGSLVLLSRPDQPRSLSLLPPIHIAVADWAQLLPDLFDLFERETAAAACVSIITGPSKTGDIEGKLVTGVHGPGEIHVVLIVGGHADPAS